MLASSWVRFSSDLARRTGRYAWSRFATSEPLRVAPYPMALYQEILESLRRSPRIWFVTAKSEAPRTRPNLVSLYLRHDLDQNLGALVEMARVEMGCGIRSSIQMRVDGADYEVESIADVLRDLKALGFEIGLHTQAYLGPEPEKAFAREVEVFERLLGGPPDSVSTHGISLSATVIVKRWRFRWFLRRSGVPSAEILYQRVPTLASGDSARLPRSGERYLDAGILRAPDCAGGSLALWLTHPCYWS